MTASRIMQLTRESIQDFQGVIFDMDGSLYNQSKMRKAMARELLIYYFLHPWRLKELWILYNYRREHGKHSGTHGVREGQYRWTADRLGVPEQTVRTVVERWIFNEPLKYLRDIRYEGIVALLLALKKNGKRIAIFSEYPTEKKLQALGLSVDIAVSSMDETVDSLKPDPKGFLEAAVKMKLQPHECLVVGDREEKDGEGARRAGMSFFLMSEAGNKELLNEWSHARKSDE